MRCAILFFAVIFWLYYSVLGQDLSSIVEDPSEENIDEQDVSDLSDGSSDSGDYEYPCGDSGDIDTTCVRNYLVSSTRCKGVAFDESQPVFRRRQIAYIPKINVTLKTYRDIITFSGSKIEKLFINHSTRKLIITVSFESLRIESLLANYIINQIGEEPIIAGDSVNVTYTPTLTAVIPIRRRLNMRQAIVSAYNYDSNPPYEMGPKLTENSNPVVARTIDALFSNFDTVIQEIFLTEAYSFFIAYVQSLICSFGIPLSY